MTLLMICVGFYVNFIKKLYINVKLSIRMASVTLIPKGGEEVFKPQHLNRLFQFVCTGFNTSLSLRNHSLLDVLYI